MSGLRLNGVIEAHDPRLEGRIAIAYQPAIPAEPSRFIGASATDKLAAAIVAQAGKTVTIIAANDTTPLPSDYSGAAIDYVADRAGRWTHTSDTFGKARRTFKAQHPAHNGSAMATLHIETEALGNRNGPGEADYGASIAVVKKGFGTGTAAGGEIDGLTIFVRNDGPQGAENDDPERSDASGILINAQKIGDCGWIAGIEMSSSQLDPSTFALAKQIQIAIGVINGASDDRGFAFTATSLYDENAYAMYVAEDVATSGTWQGIVQSVKANGTQFRLGMDGEMLQLSTAWTDWAWRLTRPDATDAPLSIEQRGTGGILLSASDLAEISFATSSVVRAKFEASGNFVPDDDLSINLGAPDRRFSEAFFLQAEIGGVKIIAGDGSPEGVVTAPVGSKYLRNDGSSGTFEYRKNTGSGNTGWSAVL